MTQRGSENLLLGRLLAERRLGSGRLGSMMYLDFPWVAIPCERRQLLPSRATDYSLKRPSWHFRQLPDGVNTDLGESRAGDRAHSPHQLDGKVVQEIQFGLGIDDY
jgi:hypothetical protein